MFSANAGTLSALNAPKNLIDHAPVISLISGGPKTQMRVRTLLGSWLIRKPVQSVNVLSRRTKVAIT